jgi:hypothetical protein
MKSKRIINYKYNEGEILEQIKSYIDDTYSEHYSTNNYQATEFIIDGGHGEGFCIGNIMKYAQRYGKKDGYNRKDLMKIIHYAIIALYNHDQKIDQSSENYVENSQQIYS